MNTDLCYASSFVQYCTRLTVQNIQKSDSLLSPLTHSCAILPDPRDKKQKLAAVPLLDSLWHGKVSVSERAETATPRAPSKAIHEETGR